MTIDVVTLSYPTEDKMLNSLVLEPKRITHDVRYKLLKDERRGGENYRLMVWYNPGKGRRWYYKFYRCLVSNGIMII